MYKIVFQLALNFEALEAAADSIDSIDQAESAASDQTTVVLGRDVNKFILELELSLPAGVVLNAEAPNTWRITSPG